MMLFKVDGILVFLVVLVVNENEMRLFLIVIVFFDDELFGICLGLKLFCGMLMGD